MLLRPLTRFCFVLTFMLAGAAGAQQDTPAFASAFLPQGHWAVDAVRRLNALGLTDRRFAWGEGSLTRREVGRVLRDAAAIAFLKRNRLTPVASAYWTRFADEFPATAAVLGDREMRAAYRGEGSATVGYSAREGHVLPGNTFGPRREEANDPVLVPDRSEASVLATWNVIAGPYLAGSITPQRVDGDWRIAEGYGVLAWRKLGLWYGRRGSDFGPGVGGGIIFNGDVPVDGGGIFLTEPVVLPWVFRYLGPVRVESFLSQIDSSAAIKKPWMFGFHGSISPHPRLLLAVHYGAMFAGEGVAAFNFRNFWNMFRAHGMASAGTEYENGLAAAEARFRPPVGALPIVVYAEWGADDNHHAFAKFPAVVAGVELAAVPGLNALSVGLERTSFARPCSGCKYYATWYRHYKFRDGWTVDRRPLGHPLGGDGWEWLAYGRYDVPEKHLRLSARTFLRERGEYNTFARTRAGRSIGGQLGAEFQASRDVDAVLEGALESGDGWHQSNLFLGLRLLF